MKPKPYTYSSSTHFNIEVRGADLGRKRKVQGHLQVWTPNLILRERTKTDDDARWQQEAFQAAVAKARELGWIV